MAREMIDTYHGYAQQDVILTIPDGQERAGTWHGVIRARLVDQETDEWFFEIAYSTGPGMTYIGAFPVEWTRRPELDDFIGIIPGHFLEQLRADTTMD